MPRGTKLADVEDSGQRAFWIGSQRTGSLLGLKPASRKSKELINTVVELVVSGGSFVHVATRPDTE